MTEHAQDVTRPSHHGTHEPGPGTVPAADLLAGFDGDDDEGSQHATEVSALGDGDDADRSPAGDDGSPASPIEEARPVLVATGLGLHTGRGWVFRDIDLTVPPATVTAIVAPAGSGRSSLLLALTGRMRVTDGTLSIAGRSAVAEPRAARRRTAVARVADLIVPEGRLTVAESVTERCLIDGVRTQGGRAAFGRACAQMALAVDGAVLVEHLPAAQQAILALALAAARPADVIVLDDTDSGVDAAGEREIYRAAVALAAAGPAVITATARRGVLPDGVTVLDLTAALPAPADAHIATDAPEDAR